MVNSVPPIGSVPARPSCYPQQQCTAGTRGSTCLDSSHCGQARYCLFCACQEPVVCLSWLHRHPALYHRSLSGDESGDCSLRSRHGRTGLGIRSRGPTTTVGSFVSLWAGAPLRPSGAWKSASVRSLSLWLSSSSVPPRLLHQPIRSLIHRQDLDLLHNRTTTPQ